VEFSQQLTRKGDKMFKAAIKVASHSAISNKDRKKLKKDLCKNFPTDIIDIVFINSDEISATKLQNGPITIYSDEQAPLFIDSTGEGDFFPSLYAVNFYPDLCRNLFLKEGVEAFIFKGANLMWAGVDNIDALPSDLNADDVVALRRASDKKVVAVGALACDVESVKGKSADGVACYILHMEGDNLWGCGSKTHTPAKYDRKVQEEKEQEALKQLEKKEKKRHQEEDEEEEDDIDNFAGFIKHKNEGMVVDMSKGSKLKHMPKELKGTQEAKAPKGGKAAKEEPKGKGGKDKDEADHKGGKGGKDKDDKKGDKKGAKDDKKGGKGKDDDKKGKKGGKADKGKKKDEASDEEEEMEEASEPEDKKGGDDEEQNESAGQSGDEGSGSEDDKKTKGGKGKAGKAKGKEEKKKEDEPVVTKEQMKQMDDMIMESFLNACKMSITEKDLPIECGKLLTDHIIKCKPQDDFDIDLKISSHKKIGKFLQQLQKEKLLTYEEASKKNPVPKVTKIEFHHKKIADWTPTLTGKALEKRIKDQEKEDGANQNSWKVTVEISKLYKPNDAVKAFLEKYFTTYTAQLLPSPRLRQRRGL
jgi:predicted ribosome-associated RNA-binding protein Tma20